MQVRKRLSIWLDTEIPDETALLRDMESMPASRARSDWIRRMLLLGHQSLEHQDAVNAHHGSRRRDARRRAPVSDPERVEDALNVAAGLTAATRTRSGPDTKPGEATRQGRDNTTAPAGAFDVGGLFE